MRVAVLFPGQGAQYVGMGADLYREFPEARQVFDTVDEALGEPISRLCFEGPADQLNLTANTQPAILAASIAAWRVLAMRGLAADLFAGLSLGEYSAHVAAGSLDLPSAAATVRRRGELMQDAVPPGVGAMAAVLGLDADTVADICARAEAEDGGIVRPANFNCPGQIVISGHAAAVDRAVELARERGAKRCQLLPVSAPFHSPLMEPARIELARFLDTIEVSHAEPPVVTNAAAQPVTEPADIVSQLTTQVTSPVQWEESVRYMVDRGITTFVEVGPGTALSGFVRRIDRSLSVAAAAAPGDVDGALALAKGAAR